MPEPNEGWKVRLASDAHLLANAALTRFQPTVRCEDLTGLAADLRSALEHIERMERTERSLRKCLGTYCTCIGDGAAPMGAYDCAVYPCRAGKLLASLSPTPEKGPATLGTSGEGRSDANDGR